MSDLGESFFNEEERKSMGYGACVGTSTIVGVGMGAFVGNAPGAVVGAIAGLLWGMKLCTGTVSQAVGDKFLTSATGAMDKQLAAQVKLVQQATGVKNKSDALYLLAIARRAEMSGFDVQAHRSGALPARTAATLLLSSRPA